MANSDKNILITPNRGQVAQPSIVFTGEGNDPITLRVLDETVGEINFQGSAGQLFGITDNLTSGSIFSVNDISGMPIIDVYANRDIALVPLGGKVGIGTTDLVEVFTVETGNVLIKNGQLKLTDNSSFSALTITQTGTGNALVVEDSTNPDATPFVITSSGNVGIGITIPGTKLAVDGEISATQFTGSGSGLTNLSPSEIIPYAIALS